MASVIDNADAISRFVRPSASSTSTSRSRATTLRRSRSSRADATSRRRARRRAAPGRRAGRLSTPRRRARRARRRRSSAARGRSRPGDEIAKRHGPGRVGAARRSTGCGPQRDESAHDVGDGEVGGHADDDDVGSRRGGTALTASLAERVWPTTSMPRASRTARDSGPNECQLVDDERAGRILHSAVDGLHAGKPPKPRRDQVILPTRAHRPSPEAVRIFQPRGRSRREPRSAEAFLRTSTKRVVDRPTAKTGG